MIVCVMFLILDALILVDEIVGLVVHGVVSLLDDEVVVNIFWKCF